MDVISLLILPAIEKMSAAGKTTLTTHIGDELGSSILLYRDVLITCGYRVKHSDKSEYVSLIWTQAK